MNYPKSIGEALDNFLNPSDPLKQLHDRAATHGMMSALKEAGLWRTFYPADDYRHQAAVQLIAEQTEYSCCRLCKRAIFPHEEHETCNDYMKEDYLSVHYCRDCCITPPLPGLTLCEACREALRFSSDD